VFTENEIRFGFEKTELNDEAKAVLDEFAAPLKEKNQGIFIEVQGHTDSSGPEEYNLILGEQRAEAVRRYLNQAHSVPLHRMSVISYGESEPLADNSTREGRVQNRRVALVVLQ
jgi:outer membrane protein OmpA-like peptidoglycan-associated protein